MSDLANIAQRSVLTMQALATLGVDPQWDALITDLLRLDALARAEVEFGPQRIREDGRYRAELQAEHRYGKGYVQHPDVKPMLERLEAEASSDEETMFREFYAPLWAAQRAVVQATPPSLAAALFKAALIETAEVWNDANMDRDCAEIVRSDLQRFGGAA